MECLDGYIKIAQVGSCVGCAFNPGCNTECEDGDYIFIHKPKQETMKPPEIYESTHPHHAVWRKYTESLLAGKPKRLEFRASVEDFWINANPNTTWNVDFMYRIKSEPKKFWYMNGEKLVEFVEPVEQSKVRCMVEIHINGERSCYQTFTTRDEAEAVLRKLTNTFITLKVK